MIKVKHSKCETSFNYNNHDLVEALEETISDVELSFGKPDEISKQIVYKYILNVFKQMQLDCDNLGYIEFFKKYINDYKMLSVDDATVSQMIQIIDEAPMSYEDKEIATKLFVEFKTYEQIADELNIADARTIGNNKDRIRDILKQTAFRLFLK